MRTEIIVKTIDVNDDRVCLYNYKFKNGDFVKKDQIILITETTKKAHDILSVTSGYIFYAFAEGDEVSIGSAIAFIFDTEDEYEEYIKQHKINDVEGNKQHKLATEKAKEMAEKYNIDLSSIPKDGIIKESDVKGFIENQSINTNTFRSSVYRYDRERIVVVGAGRGAEVLIDLLRDQFDKQVVLLVDDIVKEFLDYRISSYNVFEFPDKADRGEFDTAIISFSANQKIMKLRAKIFEYYRERGIEFTNIIAKNAELRGDVKIGQGNVIGANVYVGTKTILGDNNTISYHTVIGHHNNIGNCNLIAPGVVMSGCVSIGNDCIIPAGVNFISCVNIGSNVVLPVGYNVNEDIPGNTFIK